MIVGTVTRAWVVAGLAGAGVLGAAAAPAGPGRPQLVTTTPEGAPLNAQSYEGNLSPDGRRCVFETKASDFGLPSSEGMGQVVHLDRATGGRELISVGTAGEAGNGESYGAFMTASGRWVLFESESTNLVDDDGNGKRDVFLRDRRTGETRLLSRDASGDAGTGFSGTYGRALTENGRTAVFYSDAPDLVEGVGNDLLQVYALDLRTGEVTLVSVGTDGNPGNGASTSASVTPNGRFVVFDSNATNLVTGDENGWKDVFLRDLKKGTTVRVSVSTEGGDAQGGSSANPSVSSNGRYVSFDSLASNLVPSDGNGKRDAFLRDLKEGTTTRLTVNADGVEAAGGHTYYPSISGSGRWVAFGTSATNLNRDQTSPNGGVYVVDTRLGTITQVDLGPAGDAPDGEAYVWPWALTSNGKWLLMSHGARQFTDGDTGGLDQQYAVPLR